MTITRWCKNLKSLHWGSWRGGRKGLSPPAAPGFEFLCARLSPPRCLTCPLDLQGVQWAVGLVVVRASWPEHPRKSKKKKTWNHFFNCIIKIDSEQRYLNFFFFLFIYLYSNMINQKKNTEVTLFTILVLCSSSSFLNFSCIIFKKNFLTSGFFRY